ncbi:metallophosphoesterase family protein [Bacillus alkalicellulosilyticus]|uniref:metallophosphoesterase family protein n=1 Tax=Alkalihalobacterium alkalicellulosilyticum TaxID=1912214 RepID=UPI0009960434|nr:metallophosphoesterase family protein [Bacillus alkalicellulosilyticus]
MKIVVIGDTHIPKRAKIFPTKLEKDLIHADLIIHTGDWQTIEVYEELNNLGNVIGVFGNVDSDELVARLPERVILPIGDFTLGIIHGHGTKGTTQKRALAAFSDEKVDCILFGHSHIPTHTYHNHILLFNPGSPTDKRRQSHFSYGILDITDKIEASHIFFEDKS